MISSDSRLGVGQRPVPTSQNNLGRCISADFAQLDSGSDLNPLEERVHVLPYMVEEKALAYRLRTTPHAVAILGSCGRFRVSIHADNLLAVFRILAAARMLCRRIHRLTYLGRTATLKQTDLIHIIAIEPSTEPAAVMNNVTKMVEQSRATIKSLAWYLFIAEILLRLETPSQTLAKLTFTPIVVWKLST